MYTSVITRGYTNPACRLCTVKKLNQIFILCYKMVHGFGEFFARSRLAKE